MHWPTVFKNLLRLALTVGVVVAIGAAFLVLAPAPANKGGLQVKPSQADITWMTPVAPTPTQRFAAALQDLGHEAPRAYDLNGNNVYFSTRLSRKSPERLLAEYQQAFVDHGVNSRMWMQSTDALSHLKESPGLRKRLKERADAAINGEILPVKVTDQYMSMNGMLFDKETDNDDPDAADEHLEKIVHRVESAADRFAQAYKSCNGDPKILAQKRGTKEAQAPKHIKKLAKAIGKRSSCGGGGAKECSDWQWKLKHARADIEAYVAAIKEQPTMMACEGIRKLDRGNVRASAREFAERIHGYRSIEAFRDKKSGQTMVTAAWSDGDFDMTKMLPSAYGLPDQDNSPIPLCSTCKRAYSFVGSGAESADSSHEIWSNQSVDRVAADYTKTLTKQGWELHDANHLMQKVYGMIDMPPEAGRVFRFVRGNRHLTLTLRPDRIHNRTRVTAFTSK